MLSNLGNFLLFFNAFLSIIIIYYSLQNVKSTSEIIPSKIFKISLIQTSSVMSCFFTLVAAFVISDFSLSNVYQNSHTAKPFFYKIAGTWGSHEGSLMLWIIILTIFSFIFLIKNKKHPKNYRLYTLIIQNIIILGFLFFILFNSNPFAKVLPVPTEGLG